VAVQFFIKFSTVKVNENPSAVLGLFNVYGRTDELSELHLWLPRFANEPEMANSMECRGYLRDWTPCVVNSPRS
jgi:hypothetical protein